MSRIMLGIMLVLLLGCVAGGVVIKIQHDKNTSLTKDYNTLNQNYTSTLSQMELLKSVRDIDENISLNVGQVQVENTQKEIEIIQKIDETTKQVNLHEISPADADNAYSHSMWDAYCQATGDSSSCSTR